MSRITAQVELHQPVAIVDTYKTVASTRLFPFFFFNFLGLGLGIFSSFFSFVSFGFFAFPGSFRLLEP